MLTLIYPENCAHTASKGLEVQTIRTGAQANAYQLFGAVHLFLFLNTVHITKPSVFLGQRTIHPTQHIQTTA